MADTQTSALETGNIPQGYEEVPDEPAPPAGYEDAPEAPKPSFQPTIFGIPTAAAARIGGVVTRVFNKAGEDAAKNFVSTFSSLADQDKADLVANGYGNYSGPGALLQHAADTFNSGLAIIKDGFFATGAAIEGGVSGFESQIAREMGAPEDVAKSAGREGAFIGMAAQSDIGAMHGASMVDAAKANMTAPGVWGDVYRMDRTNGPPDGPDGGGGGGLTRIALGRFPDGGAEAAQQAKVAATNLGLGDKTADLIHRTYLETGRPPAETLMDAQTDHGGVLTDLLAGRVPTVYLGAKSHALPVLDTAELGRLGREATLNEQDAKIAAQLDNLSAGDLSAEDRLNRLAAVDDQLKDENLKPQQRRALEDRRDQILVDTNPEALKAAAQPLIDRRNLEAQRLRIAEQLGDIERERRAAQTETALSPVPKTEQQVSPVGGGPSSPFPAGGSPEAAAVTEAPKAPEPPTAPAGAAEPGKATGRPAEGAAPTGAQPAKAETVFPQVEQPEPGVSKVGKRVEAAAIEDGLTQGFPKTAEYGTKEVEDQKVRVADLVGNDPDRALAVMRGQQPVPDGMSPVMLLRGLGVLARQTKDGALLEELANSPLASSPAYAAQELRLTQELDPAMAAIQELKQSLTKAAGGVEEVTRKQRAFKAAANDAEVKGIVLPKEQLSWDRFLESIKC